MVSAGLNAHTESYCRGKIQEHPGEVTILYFQRAVLKQLTCRRHLLAAHHPARHVNTRASCGNAKGRHVNTRASCGNAKGHHGNTRASCGNAKGHHGEISAHESAHPPHGLDRDTTTRPPTHLGDITQRLFQVNRVIDLHYVRLWNGLGQRTEGVLSRRE